MAEKFNVICDDEDGKINSMTIIGLKDATVNQKNPEAILGMFANSKLKEEAYNDISFEMLEPTKRVRASDNKMQVVEAKIDSRSFRSKTEGVLRVAIYNKKTNKVRVVSTSNLRFLPYFEQDEINAEDDADDSRQLTYRDKNDVLIKTFGGTKGNQLVDSRKRNNVASQSMLAAAVGEALDNAPVPVLNKVDTDAFELLPPYHLDAARPQDAYRLEDLLTENEMDALAGPAMTFADSTASQRAEWCKNKTYAKYILDRLEKLPLNTKERKKRCQVLMYFHYLLVLFRMKAADWKRKNPLPAEMPESLKKKMIESFTRKNVSAKGQTTQCMDKHGKDKVLLHMLVTALILDDFSLQFNILQDDIGKQFKLREYFEQIGCKVSVSKKMQDGSVAQSAVLQTPLTFPKPKEPRGSKRKQ